LHGVAPNASSIISIQACPPGDLLSTRDVHLIRRVSASDIDQLAQAEGRYDL
jgi:hypothetical protein